MKDLISLSLKYIRRQKMRTVLSFLCIMLSVFILNTVSAYMSSGLRSMKNYVTDNEGSWEVNIDALIEKYPDKAEALDIIENHAAIGDYVYHYFEMAEYSSASERNEFCFAEVSLDGGEPLRVNRITYNGDAGNRKLDSGRFGYMYAGAQKDTAGLSGNQFIMPDWVRELGYDVGDKVTLSITPAKGSLPESSQQRKDTLDRIKKHNAERSDDDYYYILEGEEAPEDVPKKYVKSSSLIGYILEDNGIDDIELENEQRAEPYTVDIEISGFFSQDNSMRSGYIYNNDHSRVLEMYGGSGCIFSFSDHAQACVQDFPVYHTYNGVGCNIRTNDNYDFDECLMLLLRDMGYSDDQYYEFFLNEALHSDLLMVEFKSARAIGEAVPSIAIGLVIMALIWLLVRFIIDNAFEISVQERSVQFAQLRVMGASKAQIMAVVFTEAIFYTLTAVPIGTLLAFLCCRSVVGSFARAGIDYFEFAVNPVITIIGVLLCVMAIFVSANTSALWATRKLSPAEALSFGKPKKQKQKKLRLKKSKTDKKRKGFIVRYTLKNIFRTKKRFFIATVAMSLSVMIFTVCAFLGIYGYGELLPVLNDIDYHDFYIHCESMDDFEEKSEMLRSSDSIADVRSSMYIQSKFGSMITNEKNIISQMIPYEERLQSNMPLSVVQKEDYERYVEKLAGMSYEEFVASEGAMYLVNPYGNPMSFADEYGREPILRYEDYYKSASELGFSQEPLFKSTSKTSIKLIGSVCSEEIFREFGFDELLIPAELAKEILESDRQNYYESVNLYVKVNGEKNYKEALELCEGLAGSFDFINNYYTGTGLRTYISAIVKLVLIFLLSVWLVGVLTMTNCVNTSVLNRQKELMMMRSVGMSRKQLAGTVILESVIFSAFSVIIGTILGVLAFVVLKLMLVYVNAPLFWGAAIATVAISLLLNLIFAVLAALPGMDSLKKRMS